MTAVNHHRLRRGALAARLFTHFSSLVGFGGQLSLLMDLLSGFNRSVAVTTQNKSALREILNNQLNLSTIKNTQQCIFQGADLLRRIVTL